MNDPFPHGLCDVLSMYTFLIRWNIWKNPGLLEDRFFNKMQPGSSQSLTIATMFFVFVSKKSFVSDRRCPARLRQCRVMRSNMFRHFFFTSFDFNRLAPPIWKKHDWQVKNHCNYWMGRWKRDRHGWVRTALKLLSIFGFSAVLKPEN